MNKKLIALAVAAVATTGSVNAAEIYNDDSSSLAIGGRAEARLAMKDGSSTDNSRVRINVEGKTDIGEDLYAVGFYEAEYNANDNASGTATGSDATNSVDHRYTYAGMGGKFGEVTYGKNDGALGVITDFTDIMAYHGNSAAMKLDAADRMDNNLTYKGSFDNLSVKANYRFSDANEGATGDKDNGGYAMSAIYAIGDTGLALGAGYADQDKGTNLSENEMMFAASYTMGNLYFAGTYTDGEVVETGATKAVDYTGYELAAAYTMGKTVFSSTYNNAETDKADSADNFAVDATHYFNDNFRSYVSYNFNLLDEGNGVSKYQTEDELVLGMRYDF